MATIDELQEKLAKALEENTKALGDEVKERRHYKKPSVAKKEKRIRAERVRKREQLNRLKAQERRNRNK